MSDELQIFNFGSKKIQEITDVENVNWFVASDICEALDIVNMADAMSRIDDEDKSLMRIQTATGFQSVSIVNEAGALFLTFSSRKEKAKPFKHWFFHECLNKLKAPIENKKYDTKELDLLKEHCTQTKVREITAQIEHKYCPAAERAFYAEKEERVRCENFVLDAIYGEESGHRFLTFNSLLDVCYNLDEKQLKEILARLLEKENIDKKAYHGETVYFLYVDEYTRLFLSATGQKAIE